MSDPVSAAHTEASGAGLMPAAGPPEQAAGRAGRVLLALVLHPRLPRGLAAASTLLLLPTLGLGFHLDDFVHRYLFSGLPGSAALLRAYQSPFGIANGDPASNHWQVEQGYAPWWIYPRLLVSMYRPLSALTHRLDAALWPDSAPLQHAHSLLFYFALVYAVTRLYRGLLGTSAVAGVAAVMYAFDHTHGFAVGWIANRNAVVCALLGVCALASHQRARSGGSRAHAVLSPLLFGCALLAGEGAIAIFGYLLGYALFLERGPLALRLRTLLPHLLVLAGWRVLYRALGRGAAFSGLYIDPGHEPLRFALAVLQRAPRLLLGQLGLPPAESSQYLSDPLQHAHYALALLVAGWLLASMLPLLRADATARFFGFGMLAALVPACTTHPNNRLLFFVGLGALGLLAQLWHGLLARASWLAKGALWQGCARTFVIAFAGFHLFLSPLLLPLTACSIALTSPAEAAAESARAQAAGRDLVVVGSPDYFYVKLLPELAALEQRPAPRRVRALCFGAVPLRIERPDAQTLDLAFGGGLLAAPLQELYRARELVMPVGSVVQLRGLRIEVRALTADRRVAAARFRFDAPLEDPRFVFVTWDGSRYRSFRPPPVGGMADLPPARLPFGL